MSSSLVVLLLNGLAWGLIVALIALGLSIIFGLLDVINLAHGDLFMVGTVLAWTTVERTGSFALALVLVPLLGATLGFVTERLAIRPILKNPSLTVVSTFGLSMILQEAARATFGGTPQRLTAPVPGTIEILGIPYDLYRVVAAVTALAALGVFFVFQQRTVYGTWMRAVRHDRETATTLGIPVVQVQMFTFALGCGLALFGGVIAAPITTVDFRAGVDILPSCFMAVVIGPAAARIVSLCLMLVHRVLRPQGLFAGASR